MFDGALGYRLPKRYGTLLHAYAEGFSSATEQEITERVPEAARVLVVD
ncbi:MAG: hypothetical protein M3495_14785 [Pseudomonadota bacterium]|nr:hypothetical protein [Pseudomonadota bacterium]